MSDGLEEAGLRFVTEGDAAFRSAISGAQNATDGFYDTLGKAPDKASGAQAALTGAFTAISSAAIEAFAAAGKAALDFVGGGIKDAADFEQSLNVLKATSGATGEEIKKVSDLAFQLGNDMSLPASSAKDASDAILELVKSGLSLDDAMAAAKGTLLLATAAETDAGNAASIVAGTLNAFNLKGEEAAKVVDLLAGAAGKGAGNITDYADGFKQAGGLFFAAGQDADSLAASLQVLVENNMSGSDAGTALKNTMMALQKPTDQASKLMESLGINVYDAQGNMKPFNEIIGIFNDKLGGMTQEQRNATLGTIFLSDGMKAMIPLLNQGKAAFDARTKAVAEAGSAQAQADAQTEGFIGVQKALENAMGTLQLSIGMKLLPTLTDLIRNVVIPGANAFIGFMDGLLGSGDAVGALANSLGIMLPSADALQLMIAQIGAEIVPVFQTIYTAVSGYVSAIVSYISAGFAEVQKFLAAHGDEIMAVFKAAWDTIKTIIEFAAFVYNKLISPAIEQVAKNIRDHSKEIQAIFTVVWTVIRTVISTALNLIQGIIKVVMALINGDIDGAMKIIQQTITTIWNDIKKAVEDIVSALKNAIGTQFEQIKTSISNAIGGALQSVKDTLNNWVEVGKGIIGGIVDGIRLAAQGLYDFLHTTIVNAILVAISGLPTFLQDEIKRLLGITGSTVSGYSAAGRGKGYGGNTYGGNTYNLNVVGQPSMGIVSDFAIMKAWGG